MVIAMNNKKAQEMSLGGLLGIGMTFVVLTIGLAVGLQVTGDVKQDMCNTYNSTSDKCAVTDPLINSDQYNATQNGIIGLAKFPQKLPIIATVVVASVLIGILVRNLVGNLGG